LEHLLTIKKQDWQFLPQPKGVWVSLPKIDESQLEFYKKEKKKNKKFQFIHRPLKPIASGKFSLITFISAIYQSNPYLKIINNPNKPKPIKKK